jgi:hypothetical protein
VNYNVKESYGALNIWGQQTLRKHM